MKFQIDERIVMTLDAGGTNFVFSAIQGNNEIIKPIVLPSNSNDLDLSLNTIVAGFNQVKEQLISPPVAISFAFPGPADYPNGIIGDLGNLPCYRGGVALGPMLEELFCLPTFINNDGDLYAYGEALSGFLPDVNSMLEKAGSNKRYKNLIGFTLGTGFGSGIVRDGELFLGDNSMAGEVWLLRNKLFPQMNAEEGVSIRAIQRVYADRCNDKFNEQLTPKDIFDIAEGKSEGNKEAALEAFSKMAETLGDAIANVMTLIDGLVVIGGGLSNAYQIYLHKVIEEINSKYKNFSGDVYPRLVAQVFNLEDETELQKFLKDEKKIIKVTNTAKTVGFDMSAKLGVGISKIGASKAVALGAYAFALNSIDKKNRGK